MGRTPIPLFVTLSCADSNTKRYSSKRRLPAAASLLSVEGWSACLANSSGPAPCSIDGRALPLTPQAPGAAAGHRTRYCRRDHSPAVSRTWILEIHSCIHVLDFVRSPWVLIMELGHGA